MNGTYSDQKKHTDLRFISHHESNVHSSHYSHPTMMHIKCLLGTLGGTKSLDFSLGETNSDLLLLIVSL